MACETAVRSPVWLALPGLAPGPLAAAQPCMSWLNRAWRGLTLPGWLIWPDGCWRSPDSSRASMPSPGCSASLSRRWRRSGRTCARLAWPGRFALASSRSGQLPAERVRQLPRLLQLHRRHPPRDGRDRVSALLAVAGDVQDAIMGSLMTVWPVCPDHDLGGHPREHDGQAVWWCNGDGGHVIAPIGHWSC